MGDHLPQQPNSLHSDPVLQGHEPTEHLLTHDIQATIERGEQMRLTYMKEHRGRSFIAMTLSLIIISAGGAAFGWFLLYKGDILRSLGYMALALAPPAYLYFWAHMPIKLYKRDYKKTFLTDLAKAMGRFQYHPTRGISANILSKTGVVPPYKDYQAEDCFIGTHNGAKIILCEARLKKDESDKNHVFDGMFALVELKEKSFEGHTIVTANARLADRMTKLQPLPIIGSGYEDKLSCFTNDASNSERFQNKALLKELSELIDVFDDAPLSAAFFREKYIFVAIPHKADMFEASTISVPITTTQTALQCKREIEQILSIIDIMDVYGVSETKTAT